MDRRLGTAKLTVALVACACVALAIAFLAPPVARVAIALVALPLTVALGSSMVSGTERQLPSA